MDGQRWLLGRAGGRGRWCGGVGGGEVGGQVGSSENPAVATAPPSALPLSGRPEQNSQSVAGGFGPSVEARRAPRPREIDLATVRTAATSNRGSARSWGTTTDTAAAN